MIEHELRKILESYASFIVVKGGLQRSMTQDEAVKRILALMPRLTVEDVREAVNSESVAEWGTPQEFIYSLTDALNKVLEGKR